MKSIVQTTKCFIVPHVFVVYWMSAPCISPDSALSSGAGVQASLWSPGISCPAHEDHMLFLGDVPLQTCASLHAVPPPSMAFPLLQSLEKPRFILEDSAETSLLLQNLARLPLINLSALSCLWVCGLTAPPVILSYVCFPPYRGSALRAEVSVSWGPTVPEQELSRGVGWHRNEEQRKSAGLTRKFPHSPQGHVPWTDERWHFPQLTKVPEVPRSLIPGPSVVGNIGYEPSFNQYSLLPYMAMLSLA